ncbi:MAG: hypothetical protein ACJ76Z_15105, partial [Thermoleophilaceae bacterium]
ILRIDVGTWAAHNRIQDLKPLTNGPGASGVNARFTAPGALELLDARGRVVRRALAGTGLVAALLPKDEQPFWVVTGVDEAGVARAASLLTPKALRNAYAVAATPGGPVRLPVGGTG